MSAKAPCCKKPLMAAIAGLCFLWSNRATPQEGGDTAHAGSTTRRMLSKKTARMGDKAKPSVTHLAGGFAVCVGYLCAANFKTGAPRMGSAAVLLLKIEGFALL